MLMPARRLATLTLEQTRWVPASASGMEFLGAFTGYQKLSNSECRAIILGSQTARDKFRSRKGNSPDLQLRSQNVS